VFSTIIVELPCEQQKVERWVLVGVEVQVMMNCKKLRDDGYKLSTDM
jgi:hypothetical protein